MNIKTALSEKSVDYLADLVIKLLDGLDESQRLDFIGKYIGAELFLEALAKDDEQLLNQEDIICQVDDFCIDCLNEAYYVEAEYDDYLDDYDEDAFTDSEWSNGFAEYLRLAVIYARSGNNATAYEIFSRIFSCLHNCEEDEELLGTESPLDYIDIDKNDTFEVFFTTIAKVEEDVLNRYDRMFAIWSLFKRYCEPLLYKHIT